MSKVYLIIGHYGSGKSEFAVNFAKRLALQGEKVCLADLDIVNPYFRSRELRDKLESEGIEVISDTLNSKKGLDIPYLSPAIKGHLANGTKTMVLDCGGDDVGINVIKQFKDELIHRQVEVLMIVNTCRPLTSSVAQILEMKAKLESASGLKVKGYINNSNFLRETTVQDMLISQDILSQVSLITEVPILYVCGTRILIEQLPNEVQGERIILDLSLREKWL